MSEEYCPRCGLKFHPPGMASGPASCLRCGQEFDPRPTNMPEFVWVGGDAPLIPVTSTQPEPSIPTPPATQPDPENPVAFLDWLRAESRRFDEYVSAQMHAIGDRRQELLAHESRLEAMLIGRQQEVNRQEAMAAAKLQNLAQREQSLRERESAVARAEDALVAREAVVLERETRLAAMTDCISELERRESDLRRIVDLLDAQRDQSEAVIAGARHELFALEKRRAELERAELAVQRREAELDEIEEQVRRELDERERELTLRRAAVEPPHATSAAVRNGVPGHNATQVGHPDPELSFAELTDFPRPTYSE